MSKKGCGTWNQGAYMKMRRRTRAEGKCGVCFIRWAREDEFRCDGCAEYHRVKSLEYLRRKVASEEGASA